MNAHTKEYSKARYLRDKAKMNAQSKAWRVNNRERYNNLQRSWRYKNPEKVALHIQKKNEWAKKNPDKVRATKQKHYLKYRDQLLAKGKIKNALRYKIPAVRSKILAQCLAYRKSHPKETYEKGRRWRLNNPEKVRASWMRRYALKKAASVNLKGIRAFIKLVKSKSEAVCYYCGVPISSKSCHFDHIIPLSKGGEHSVRNLCVSCPACNREKSGKQITAWVRIGQQVLAL